jgi:fumarate reductase subunit C
LIKSGCVDALFLAVKTETDSSVLHNATAAILNLSIQEKSKNYLVEQVVQGTEIIVSLLSSQQNPLISYNLLGTLASWATHMNASSSIMNKALPIIVKSLNSQDDKILEGAIAAVYNLAFHSLFKQKIVV